MGWIGYCPLVGGRCNKGEPEIKVQMDIFFLAEPFKPEIERKRREQAVKVALKEALREKFSEMSLRFADKEPKEAIFCDICRLIQSSAYGIADISEENPNVLLELGMMISLGKPVFVLVKKKEEESLREKLPSDIIWKRVIPYEEFIDIQEELSKQIQSRPKVEPEPSFVEKTKKTLAEIDPAFAEKLGAMLQELKREQKEGLKSLENLLKEANLSETIPWEKEIKVPPSLEKKIEELYSKVDSIEKIVGFPEDYKSAFLRGNWHLHRKEYAKAIELYDWVLTLKPKLLSAWFNKGLALIELEKYEEAIECYDKAIEIKPDYGGAWINKAFALGELRKYEEAITCCDKAIEIKPDDEIAWCNKGGFLGYIGKYEESITCCDKAIEIKPDDNKTWFNKGLTLRKLGKYEEAIECYDKAIEIKPDDNDAWINRGVALGHLGRYKEAKSCCETALKINPNLIGAQMNLSEALLALGDFEKGLEMSEKALALAKEAEDKAISQFLSISAYLFKGESEKAQQEIEALIN